MDNTELKITPHIPLPYKNTNKVIKEYILPFKDNVGNYADITYIDFLDKKKKLVKGYVMFIKWRK